MSWWILPMEAVTAFAALFGVALGAFLTHWFNRNRDHLELKRDVLRRVLGYRWQLTQGHQEAEGHFFTALNEVLVVFAGDKDVEGEIDRFHSALKRGFRAEDLQPLAEAMAKSARIPHGAWSRELFENPFAPRLKLTSPELLED